MVFESIVVDLLNRLLGSYFENLDTSQLKLGIWGGDVVLKELLIKNSAMDDLGVPFKVVVGKVGTLTMKIPWSSLYTAPVELNLQDLFLLVTPSYSVKYDEQAEEKSMLAAKQAEIARLDLARAKERLKHDGAVAEKQEDTFTEKLITQIIKNVQIRIKCIHIRYEDAVTKPNSPFGCGIILKSLHVETTDTDWVPKIITESVDTVNKLAKLEGLSMYWNSKTQLMQQEDKKSEMIKALKELVEDGTNRLTYVLGPITSTAKVLLTPNPDRLPTPFSRPKFWIDLVMEQLGLGMTNLQFQDIMELVESIEFMTRAQYYRKYRPASIEHKGHYREWWRFAYKSIVEEEIRRKRQNWDWRHMERHRKLCRTYSDAYYKKLTSKKLSADVVRSLQICEKELDLFNITLVRKQVDLRIEKEGKQKAADAQKGGWFSGWFGGEAQAPSADSTMGDIAARVGEALTPEEKAKLYDAIDYSENALPLDYPETYEEFDFNFRLDKLILTIQDVFRKETKGQKILNVEIRSVETKMTTRPVKNGLKVSVLMQSLEADGMKGKNDKSPIKMITSKMSAGKKHLFQVFFESNPLDSQANQKVIIRGEPIEVVYHGPTIIHLAKCFTLPPEMQLSKLQAAAVSTINEWREQSASGLQHLIETRGEIDIDIEMLAPYFLIPQGGTMDINRFSVLVVDLGQLRIKSKPRKKQAGTKEENKGNVLAKSTEHATDAQYVETMRKFAYDTMIIELRDFGVFISLPSENFMEAIAKDKLSDSSTSIPQVLMKSKLLVLQLDQSLIPDDPRFPRLQLEGSLPLLNLEISEHRLMELVKLLVTLPFPQTDVPAEAPTNSPHPSTMLGTIAEDPSVAQSYAISKLTYERRDDKPKTLIEFIETQMKFTIDSIKIRVTRLNDTRKPTPFVDFEIKQLQAKLTSKTFSSAIDLAVGGLTLCALQNTAINNSGPLYLLKTPMTEGIEKHLFKLHMFSISSDCPKQLAGTVKQQIKADITCLDVILHFEALKSFIAFGEEINTALQIAIESNANAPKAERSTTSAPSRSPDTLSIDSFSSITSRESKTGKRFNKQMSRIDAARRAVAKKHTNPSDILLQIDAKMESLTVQLSYEKKNLIKAVLREMNFSMKQKPGRTVMLMELCDLGVRNLNPRSIYNDLLSVDSDKVMSIHVVMYDDATKGSNYLDMSKHDMSVKLETGSPKIFYIGRLIDETLAFIDNFAAAKEAVIDASAAAAAAAKENVEQVYTAGSATRILLDINLKAPIIYIPRNEKSQQGLLADLGRLNLKNKFEKIHVAKESAYAISDRMDIQLTDMKLSRIYFDPQTQKLQSEVLLLDPVNLKLTMERNLSADWFHDVPNIGLIGTLRKAHIRASNEDYDVMMATLMENIAYAPDAPPVKVKIPIAASTAAQRKKEGKVASHSGIKGRKSSMTLGRRKTVSDTKATTVLMNYKKPPGSEETSRVSSSMTIVPPKLEPEPVYPSIKVRLDFPQLRIIMYQKGSVKLEECKGVVERKESTAFADFVILNVGVNFESWTNGSMVCPITVEDITLKDIRPGKRAVMNLIQRKLDYDDGVNQAGNTIEKALARFNYTVDVDENFRKINMLLETTSLTLVLCLDYLLQLLDFFSRSEDPGMKSEPAVKQERHPTTASSAIGPAREDVIPDDIEHEILPPEPALEEYFKGIYNFNETEIILVESMESVSSNALLLHCEVSLNQTATGGRSNMMGVVENFKLCTCKYNAENRYESMAEVISPTSVNMVMNTSEMVGTLIDINISDIFIRMTAGTLELLLKIVGTIGASGASGETDLEKQNYSDLWLAKKNEDMKFWFLNPDASVEVGLEALKAQEDKAQLFKETLKVSERLVLESGAIVFTFETGMGSNTMPMLLIETDVDMQVFDWSTNMTLAGRMKLEAAYYNATYGLWEFIVEPVETRHHGKIAHQPWELLFEYSSRINPLAGAGDEDELPAVVSNSYVSIALESTDILELTVTRTALDVIDILRDDFQAATKKLVSQKAVSTAAYSIVNDTGVDVKLYLKENGIATSFVLLKDGIEYEECLLKAGTSINLNLIESSDMTRHHASVLREQEGKEERILSVEIGDYGFKKQIPVNRACKRYYPLEKRQHGHVGLICDIWVKDCSKIVTLRGVVQIENGLQVDVDIYYKDDSGTKAILAGTAVAGQKFNLPITHTYTRSGELFFAPVGYSISSDPFSWLQALKELQKISEVKCESQTTVNRPNKKLFFIKVLGEAKQALHESTNRKNIVSQCCFIYLEPPLIINNLLPVSLSYSTDTEEESQIAEKGTSLTVTDIKASIEGYCKLIMKILDYTDQNWKSEVSVDKDTPEISHWTFTSEKDPSAFLTVGLHKEVNENEITWHFYMPYWMINRTGLELVYRGDDKHSHQVVHPKKQESPVLFSFPGKAFFSKKGACVKVKHINLPTAGSDWSEKFSLDVAGSGGSVKCMSPILHFELGVEIQLSSWGLTKYVIFSPRYYLVNQCGFPVSVREADKPDHVEDLNPNSCVPFWPESKSSLLSAILKTSAGVREETKSFRYDCVRHTLLQLNNHYGGVHVDVHFTEQKTVVTFSEFIPGQAPVLLVNGTSDCPIEVTEAGQDKDVFILQPRMSKLFTWKEPSGERILHWSSVGAEKKPQGSDKLYGDGFGTYTYKSGGENKEYYWISFLDGLQRVILFTPDVELATHLQAARENEIASAEYIIMLHGVGVSLVDNEKLKELMYLRIASSEISWESCKPGKKKRFKPMHQAENKLLEQAYQNYLNQKAIAEIANSKITLDSGDEIDFMTMKINKPYEKNLRRVFQTGIWVHYKMLPNSTQFHAKINRLQIDNQMHDSVFRVIFAPVVPPKSVTTADTPKPFAEVSIMQRINAHSYVQQFKYFKILVQEFHIKLDILFVNALVEMFSGSSASRQENMQKKFASEWEEACLSSKEVLARQIVNQGQKHFYDFLHFSPLKIHISFSMGGSAQLSSHFFNLILASVGVTLTEIQDVIFKLSCLELQHSFLSGEQLYNEVYNHYSSQAIKQLYVLVLGLDVLGNPYGLAMGVASGVEAFFYEPIQGAIQGPGEFAEGLALGMKSLLGSTVGGAAGAFSKITGTLGKGIAALTMDEEYQKKRRENMHMHGDAAEGLARSGKGLVMGFVDGISGLVTQPIRGAKEDGVGGFFKGMGKGAIGLFARPAAGVVDFASGSFDAVKKCASITVEVHRMRPPRCIPPDNILQPYIKHEAEGVQLLKDLAKGKYSKTDSYIAHALINPHGIFVVLLTNKRLFYLKRDELFGGWSVEWSFIWEDFSSPPDLVEKGLLFRLKEVPSRKQKIPQRSSNSKEFTVLVHSAEVCTWLLSKIEEAMRSETGVIFTDGMEATEDNVA